MGRLYNLPKTLQYSSDFLLALTPEIPFVIVFLYIHTLKFLCLYLLFESIKI